MCLNFQHTPFVICKYEYIKHYWQQENINKEVSHKRYFTTYQILKLRLKIKNKTLANFASTMNYETICIKLTKKCSK